MSNIELRAPRRRPQKEKDQLLPIFCAVVAIGVAGFIFLKTTDHEEAAPDPSTAAAQNNNAKPSNNTATALPPQPRYQPAPQNRITTESGKTYYVPESVPRYRNSNEPTAEDEYRRASEIMESGKRTRSNYAAPTDKYHNNNRLRIADQVCQAIFSEGQIAYRHCRAEQWHLLRNGCIARRQQLNMTTGERFYSLRADATEWCDAEAEYHIID